MPLDDRRKHRLLLVLDEAGRARYHAHSDHLGEQRGDASQIAATAGREDRGDEVSRDDELCSRCDRGHDLRSEARHEPPGCRLPDEPERRSEDARNSTNLTPLRRWLDPVAATPEDQEIRLKPSLVGAIRDELADAVVTELSECFVFGPGTTTS